MHQIQVRIYANALIRQPPLELKAWIPHIAIAEKDEDIFVSELEYAVVQYVASVVNRKFGKDLGKSFRLKELADRLRADSALGNESLCR